MSWNSLKLKLTSFIVSQSLRFQIPLLAKITPKIVSSDAQQLSIRVPLKKITANPYQSMYFGALAMGAEMAAGLPVMLYMRKSKQRVSMVMRDVQGDFIKAARGDVYFRCAEVPALEKLVDLAVETRQRQQIVVMVEASCKEPEQCEVAKFAFTVSVKAL